MFQIGFPINLRDDVSIVSNLISQNTYNNISIGGSLDNVEYLLDDNVIRFPYRIYYIDNSDQLINNLSLQQKMILHCIYSRSCDGFVRQKHLKLLLLMNYEDWAIPYIVKLCDEYVLEILEMTYDILKGQNTERFKKFCLQNLVSFCKSYSRMLSYWNEYYRHRNNNFQQYVGRKLFSEYFGYTISMERMKERNFLKDTL